MLELCIGIFFTLAFMNIYSVSFFLSFCLNNSAGFAFYKQDIINRSYICHIFLTAIPMPACKFIFDLS